MGRPDLIFINRQNLFLHHQISPVPCVDPTTSLSFFIFLLILFPYPPHLDITTEKQTGTISRPLLKRLAYATTLRVKHLRHLTNRPRESKTLSWMPSTPTHPQYIHHNTYRDSSPHTENSDSSHATDTVHTTTSFASRECSGISIFFGDTYLPAYRKTTMYTGTTSYNAPNYTESPLLPNFGHEYDH
ncbi:hypothetical protein GWK47_050299 [Chionoecetes opilio]|uniref:Uncharacterized protein n=1 Tax=Chionoecetes opilio TaxID=41210 RepID=A0A8J5CTS2_CHIOP|nr:hypothetical protein GWK47_050299 [Chionoecetes opilio]